jgi:hypothetical protein
LQFAGSCPARCLEGGCVGLFGGGFGKPGRYWLTLAGRRSFDGLLDLGGTEIESFRAVM